MRSMRTLRLLALLSLSASLACSVRGGVSSLESDTPELTLSTGSFSLAARSGRNPAPEAQFNGLVEGAIVKVYRDDQCSALHGELTISAQGQSWTLPTLNEGSHHFFYTVTEPSKLPSACTDGPRYDLDMTPPAIPAAVELSDPMTSPSNDNTPMYKIVGVTAGDTVKLYRDMQCSQAVVASGVVSGGSNQIELTTPALTPGVHRFYARAVDSFGNESACSGPSNIDFEFVTCNLSLFHLELRETSDPTSSLVTSITLDQMQSNQFHLFEANECGNVVNSAAADSISVTPALYARPSAASGASTRVILSAFPTVVPQAAQLKFQKGGLSLEVPIQVTHYLPIVAGLQRYYRANQYAGAADNSLVTNFVNYSSFSTYAASLLSSTAGREPRFFGSVLGLPMVRYCGASAGCTGITGGTGMRVSSSYNDWANSDGTFVFVTARENGSQHWLLSSQSAGNQTGASVGWSSGTNFRFSLSGISAASNVVNVTVPAFSTTTLEIWTARLSTSGDPSWPGMTLFRNGAVAGANAAVTTKLVGATTIPTIAAARSENSGARFLLGEFLFFSRALNQLELCALHAQLGQRYGVSVVNQCP